MNDIIVIVGPTGVGKTKLSIELKQLPEDQKAYYEKEGFTCSLTDL